MYQFEINSSAHCAFLSIFFWILKIKEELKEEKEPRKTDQEQANELFELKSNRLNNCNKTVDMKNSTSLS